MLQIAGIDVGGTHVDGVILLGGKILAKEKVDADQQNLVESIISLLRKLVATPSLQPDQIHLSTTLCTNAIVNGALDEVGMIIQAGPGLNPSFLRCGDHVFFSDGAIDHRGHVVKKPDESLLAEAKKHFRDCGLDSIGVVTKFSHRNPVHERMIADNMVDSFSHISMGHRMSGLPNFPRRVYTTWINSGLQSRFDSFRKAILSGFAKLGLNCPCFILKADGGTMPFDLGARLPCETVHSGPSASVMGGLALAPVDDDAILLDIGGTTTDIALLAQGVPLFEPYGVTIAGRPTLIRALNTRSVGLGGDSTVAYRDNEFVIGPGRVGPPMAFGGVVPTPTDAMIVLGQLPGGSREKARQAMTALVGDQSPVHTAKQLLETFCGQLHRAVEQMVEEVFSRPVYTVSALLGRKRLEPAELIVVGGPASAMKNCLGENFKIPVTVPEHFEVANAIGAARTRPTMQATLFADTSEKILSIAEIGHREKIHNGYTMKDAEKRLTQVITSLARECGMGDLSDIEFIERQELNTVSGFYTTGKILSLKAQLMPGLNKI
ncbi:hydantoinase/oxoprolinase family protein [Desulforhopalus singaporensis]|uniref:Hydantoinase/oxoprolinase N-terminal region n=1 Tax=Desulforhopalus singaporensis TaxID=91360 RepID=A0A1H0NF49_9BACT|nr:hydantoinase/oxoprolinase family protein [Desulforhopalus singaporensis]SDO91221.1 Hydantoinase/oxoprolinase N-terminal region [Desulforhopalus singaporensis]